MRDRIRAICHANGIDVVHCAWTETGRYLDAVPDGIGTILGTQDVESRVRPRELALYPPGRARWWAGRHARYLITHEPRWVRQAGVTLVCSAADRDHLVALGASPDRVWVVPPWIDGEAMSAISPASIVPGLLVFMGALDRIANVAAARFLIVIQMLRCASSGRTRRTCCAPRRRTIHV
jgi:hypothetical protein